jgi:hypothetical protein
LMRFIEVLKPAKQSHSYSTLLRTSLSRAKGGVFLCESTLQ